jgi:dipeptidyl aminopeptidase/acylaminoacyl peptidase
MPASTEKDRSVLARCLQGSNAYTIALMLLAFFPAAGTASAQQRRIQLDDLAKVVTVSDPQISPDGKSIVCVVSHPNFDEDRSDNELVLVDAATGVQRVLTFDRKDVESPRWSPSGDRLAFLAVVPYAKDKKDDSTKKEDSAQVFVMPMSAGDAKKVTDAPNGLSSLPGGRTERTSLTSPATTHPTKNRSTSTTTRSRSGTTSIWQPPHRLRLIFGW